MQGGAAQPGKRRATVARLRTRRPADREQNTDKTRCRSRPTTRPSLPPSSPSARLPRSPQACARSSARPRAGAGARRSNGASARTTAGALALQPPTQTAIGPSGARARCAVRARALTLLDGGLGIADALETLLHLVAGGLAWHANAASAIRTSGRAGAGGTLGVLCGYPPSRATGDQIGASDRPTSAPGLAGPHLRRDWPAHICAGTGCSAHITQLAPRRMVARRRRTHSWSA
jgi:hypothetical protein